MAFDAFLKIDGIEGESQDDKHKNEIQLLSYAWGATNIGSAGTGGGAGTGKVNFQDFSFSKQLDKASPKLMLACAIGTHIASAVLTLRKAGGGQQDYTIVTFKGPIVVSKYEPTGNPANLESLPGEQVALHFTEITFEYKEQKPDGSLGGSVKTGYNIAQNKKI
jgi:type VI secretion system secreted protein Hcp